MKRSIEDWVKIAKQLAKQHDGTLPNAKWLQENGYAALSRAIHTRPGQFANIARATQAGLSPEDWVPIAEELAKANASEKLTPSWLRRSGFGALAQAIRKFPHLFRHVAE